MVADEPPISHAENLNATYSRHRSTLMTSILRSAAVVSIAFIHLSAGAEVKRGEIPSFIEADHAAILTRWLSANESYRVATDADCSCDSDLVDTRTKAAGVWKARPNYHPYYTVGDFNWDKATDFAVGVVKGHKPETFQILIFHGPFSQKHSGKAAFVSEPLKLGQGLHYGPPRPKPYMLLVGPFESEGALLRPTRRGYIWD